MLQQINNAYGDVPQKNVTSKNPWWLVSKPVLTVRRVIFI